MKCLLGIFLGIVDVKRDQKKKEIKERKRNISDEEVILPRREDLFDVQSAIGETQQSSDSGHWQRGKSLVSNGIFDEFLERARKIVSRRKTTILGGGKMGTERNGENIKGETTNAA